VIPVLAKTDTFDLEVTLASIEKYLVGYRNIVLVGKRNPKFNKYKWLEIDDELLPFKNNQARVNYKILEMSKLLYGDFLVWHDDIILLSQVSVDVFRINRFVENTTWSREKAIQYNRNGYQRYMGHTFDKVRELGITELKNRSCHIPRVYNVQRLHELSQKVNLLEDGADRAITLDNLYFNIYKDIEEHIGNFRSGLWTPVTNFDPEMFNAVVFNYNEMALSKNLWLKHYLSSKYL
jgi:hypothetical protein